MERKPRNYWTYEKCYEVAKFCTTSSEFSKRFPVAYNKSKKQKWFNTFSWLIDDRINIITDRIDLVYAYEFIDFQAVYVGRTLIRRKKARDWEHIFEDDPVSRFAKLNNISVPQMRILESDLTLKEGVEKEEYYVNKYKSEGWNVLNKAKTGSIGTIAKGRWTKKSCYEEALKYTTKTDFRQNNLCAYNYAKESGWLETYTWLSKKPRKLKGSKYTYEICFKLAKECTHRTDFEHKYAQAYKIAKDNNWLKDYDWFRDGRYVGWEDRKKHTYETCYNEAKKYTTMLDFYNLGKGSYIVAYREGWIKDYYWLERDRKERGYWNNYENCYNEALKYTTRVEFRYNSSRAYYSSLNHKWIDDFTWLKRTKNKKK